MINQGAYMDSPLSNRGRKRKHAPSSAGFRRPSLSHGHLYGHGYPPQYPHDGHHSYPPQQQQPQPPQGMMPGHGQGPLGLNLPPTLQDELPDSVLDDLDRLTPRDLAVARYAKNHELLSMIFDARRIDTMQPAPSPYSNMSESDLKTKVDTLNKELSDLSESHVRKMRRLKQVLSGKVSVDSPIWDESGDGSVQDTAATPEEWANNPSRGRIVGLGFVRADTPPEIKESVPPAEEEQHAQVGDEEKQAIEALNQTHGVVQPESEPTPLPLAPAAVEAPAQNLHVAMTDTSAEQTTSSQPAETTAQEVPAEPVQPQAQAAQAWQSVP